MANTLVIDTSFGSTVGVLGHEPIVETDSRTHVEKLQVNIGKAVGQAGLTPSDLDRIVVGVGPAPFTGLRAGVVAAKAIAYATGAPLLGQDILEPQAWMSKLKRQGDTALANVDFLNDLTQDTGSEAIHHLTLAVNDARRRQLYFALYGDGCEPSVADKAVAKPGNGNPQPFVSPIVDMDIDYPQHIVERIRQAVENLVERAGSQDQYRIDIVGHGACKYAETWQGFGALLGHIIDHSVLDAGAAGLRIFADCAARNNGINLAGSRDADTIADNDGVNKIKPVEPLYLRRPDVSVPNPLKHVLNHAGATKA
ncbi:MULTISPECIES: tRNA (adenosine(37)-N6)-threonylcarbamoyltransferase complex dimerization subunit type 1 TsaB [unclassified Bifidobacterium]|uniref:tRNA (adenosine(37)-N6)-threonylcarbamoyltransferase complex dimerization subunit type 1 TsaB n=1 Tax=unclassified Bifidobacterium TaxID=2608897 RepID=UPI0023F7722A|nr:MULTISPECIES: tRNA (adenosine(37)-N6)-threonylcarbamoyltransferase complex dimerization subunit type 1 TsaB [unclassified Bifidobacterium]WEV66518.1 tRNA (adenosine(37)-N6)-threonylcarbamoyltransferase complex dimerization subunit type 1 TsaB [Bifidobacterium sp. ESL0764]WEV76204.1 tRNA (adenosine(37)-N6)-threonylcarbamoyltransferase complex dimerization subunit type 1 TsaB [Bifidobacterium sp. ESL0800]